jgi:cytochrome P450
VEQPPAAQVAMHVQYRSLVTRALSSQLVTSLEPAIERLTEELIDAFPHDGRGDLIAALAAPLPNLAIACLFGVPVQERSMFTAWADEYSRLAAGDDGADLPSRPTIRDAVGYFAYLLARRRLEPQDDLLGRLAQMHYGEAALSSTQVLYLCDQLMVAGRDLTSGLIGNGVAALLTHPDQLARVRADPGRLNAAIEETLRWDTPVLGQARTARVDTELRDVPIPAGSALLVMFAAANRDPAVFVEPDRFDIGRANAGQHLAFGRGIHFCLGAALARLEARVALRTLFGRLSHLSLDPDQPGTRRTARLMVNLRAYRSLPLVFGRAYYLSDNW